MNIEAVDIFFYLGIFQSFFFALLISNKSKKTYADKILVFWLIVIGIHLLYFLYIFNRWHFEVPEFIGYGAYLPTIHGPLFYLYYKALTNNQKGFSSRDLSHFLPFLIANLLITQFLVLPAQEKLEFIQAQHLGVRHWSLVIGDNLNNYVGPIYIVVVLYLVKKHQSKIRETLSNTEGVSLEWIKNLGYGLAFIWAVVLFATFNSYFFKIELPISPFVLIYVAVVLFVFSIGYLGFKQTSLFTDFSPSSFATDNQSSQAKYERSGLTDIEAQELKNSLLKHLDNSKPFLQSNLSLAQVASQLDISRHHLSQVINKNLQTTFFDLINSFRVKEFKNRISNGEAEKFTVLSIALSCGFNSKSAFNRIFKNQTGSTPSAYISSLKSA